MSTIVVMLTLISGTVVGTANFESMEDCIQAAEKVNTQKQQTVGAVCTYSKKKEDPLQVFKSMAEALLKQSENTRVSNVINK